MNGGRPLRFLIILLGGWTGARVVLLWPLPGPGAAIADIVGIRAAAATRPHLDRDDTTGARVPPRRVQDPTPHPSAIARPPASDRLPGLSSTPPPSPSKGDRMPPPAVSATLPPPLVPLPLATGHSRWAASAWLIARGGARQTLLGGQLGASQAGARATYTLDRGRRIAAAARFATPLRGKGVEAAIGIDWQPTRAPIHLVAEHRLSLDGGRGGPTLEVIGGFGPVEVMPGVRAEGYGQAGGIARDGVQAFADGAVRISHPLTRGRLRIDLGVGAWGGAQPGVARLDVGPSLGMSVPVAGKAIRLTLDWRERVGGAASPGSGPALSIGSDF